MLEVVGDAVRNCGLQPTMAGTTRTMRAPMTSPAGIPAEPWALLEEPCPTSSKTVRRKKGDKTGKAKSSKSRVATQQSAKQTTLTVTTTTNNPFSAIVSLLSDAWTHFMLDSRMDCRQAALTEV